jgi:LuxR family transcriptional regulator, maltose regulon positive regulatory protein
MPQPGSIDLLLSGYIYLMQVELAMGDWSAARQARQEVEQLLRRERFGTYPNWLPTMRARWWLALGQLKEASNWAAGVVFPQGAWEGIMYDAFLVVIRVYFAELRWREAVELLERWSEHLDRSANIAITITFLAQSLVALHQAGKSDQARVVATRLFALTETEGYLRVYLDEGKPMRQVLQALFPPHSRHQPQASSTPAYVSKLLAAFEQEKQGASRSPEVALPFALSSGQNSISHQVPARHWALQAEAFL